MYLFLASCMSNFSFERDFFNFFSVLLGWFCPLCMVCDSAQRLGESVPMYCCLAYFCPICTIYMLRKNTRERYGIEVSFFLYHFFSLKITEIFSLHRETQEKTYCAHVVVVHASIVRLTKNWRNGTLVRLLAQKMCPFDES